MLKSFPRLQKGEIEEVYKKLSKKEKQILEDYLEYRRARGITTEEKVKDVRRFVLQFRMILEKGFEDLNLKDLRSFLAMLNQKEGEISEHYKNTMKANLKNFLKFLFPDWSSRFNAFDDLKYNSNPRDENKINASNMISKEQIDKLIKHEPKVFWKAFLLLQYEAGLRTKECRYLRWEDVKFNVDGDISEVKIYATKTGKARTLFVEKSTHWLKMLQEEQENLDDKKVYIFHGKKSVNQPIGKSLVNIWFRRLTERVLGEQKWNYLLRHSRATELYKLAKENKISKDTAIAFMGHSEDMSNTYTHLDKNDVKNMLKNQVYHIEDLPEEKKHKLEKQVEELILKNEEMEKRLNLSVKQTDRALKMLEKLFKEDAIKKKC